MIGIPTLNSSILHTAKSFISYYPHAQPITLDSATFDSSYSGKKEKEEKKSTDDFKITVTNKASLVPPSRPRTFGQFQYHPRTGAGNPAEDPSECWRTAPMEQLANKHYVSEQRNYAYGIVQVRSPPDKKDLRQLPVFSSVTSGDKPANNSVYAP